jgi:Kef-type K+ transport system membrane component KefB
MALILTVARIAGHVAHVLGQPQVLGELLAGIALGASEIHGWHGMKELVHTPLVAGLAELGVILLLFEVGLESTVGQMARVGSSAALVATLGVVAPFLLGWGASASLLPTAPTQVHVFLGATLTATSVGITARVLKDLGHGDAPEARVILGAAVIDDVLGLLILAAVSAWVTATATGAELAVVPLLVIVGKAAVFLGGALGIGLMLTPRLYQHAARLHGSGVLLSLSLGFCFLLSWLSALAGLAPIVGAFAAGLVLERATWAPFAERGEAELEHLLRPVVGLLSPVFFVSMGARVELSSFGGEALPLAVALCVVAFAGKFVSGLGVLDRTVRRLPVSIGMAPRGEVGLIFANIGLGLRFGGQPLIDAATYSAIVLVVLVTTLATPPALAWSLRRGSRSR